MAAYREGKGVFVDYVEAAFQTDEVMPLGAVLVGDLRQSLGALSRATHQLFLRRGGVTDTAVDFESDEVKFGSRRKRWRKNFQGFLDGFEFRAALAADGDDDSGHS